MPYLAISSVASGLMAGLVSLRSAGSCGALCLFWTQRLGSGSELLALRPGINVSLRLSSEMLKRVLTVEQAWPSVLIDERS
jgi:hypothetical protein